MRPPLLAFALALFAGCSPDATSFDCQTGATRACACAGGTSGTQTCTSARTYAACACASPDAGADAGDVLGVDVAAADVAGDAVEGGDAGAPDASGACVPACSSGQSCEGGRCVGGTDAGDDGADTGLETIAPPLYRSCEPVGMPCGDGNACVAVPGIALDAGARGICTRACSVSADCPGHATRRAICVNGSCLVDCYDPSGDDTRWCSAWGTRCSPSSVSAPDSMHVPGIPQAFYCWP